MLSAHARGTYNLHPPSCSARHPPPPEPPTQTMFARGPVVAVGILLVWCYSGILFDHPVAQSAPPLRRGELGLRPVAELGPLHWRGARTPGPARRVAWVARAGWLESSRIRIYSLYPVIPAQAGIGSIKFVSRIV